MYYVLVSQSCLTLCDPMDCSLPGSSIHGIFPGKIIGVGCYFLLQEIFITQGLNPCLHTSCTAGGSLPLSHQGSSNSIEQNNNFACSAQYNMVFHIADRFSTIWATREVIRRHIAIDYVKCGLSGQNEIFCKCKIHIDF